MHDLILFLQNHMPLTAALIVVLLVLFVLELIRLQHKAAQLSPAEVTRLINRQDAAVVDIRSQEAFSSGHIVDAISVPLSDLKSKPAKLEKLRSRPVILVCNAGLEATTAAATLKQQGYNVHVLGGGIQAWRRADLPLVKG